MQEAANKFIWSFKNYNSGDTDLGNSEGEKESGAYKDEEPPGC